MKILIKNTHIIRSGTEEALKGSIAVEGGIIKHVGDVPANFVPDTVIDGSKFAAMPGLVNAHTHGAMGILRNVGNDSAFNDWLFNHIIPAEAKLTNEDIYWGTLLGIVEMIKSGTTCFADMYLHMDSVARAVTDAKMRANLSFGPITSAVRGGGLIVDMEKCAAFMDKWNNSQNGLIKTSMEIHSVYLFDREPIAEAAALAKKLGTGIHIHLSESASEIAACNEKYGMSPVEAAYEMGVFKVPVIAAHCVKINEKDIEILKTAGASPVHCPSSNLKLGNGFAPAPLLASMGINLCLGTDGAASNNNLNMFEEMHLAALIHKGYNGDPQCMKADYIISMATENGARALGFDAGKIAPGFKADIILVDMDKPHICPVNDVKSAVVYAAQAADVDTVIVDGNILMRNRELAYLDEEHIKNRVRETAARIKNA